MKVFLPIISIPGLFPFYGNQERTLKFQQEIESFLNNNFSFVKW